MVMSSSECKCSVDGPSQMCVPAAKIHVHKSDRERLVAVAGAISRRLEKIMTKRMLTCRIGNLSTLSFRGRGASGVSGVEILAALGNVATLFQPHPS